MVNQGKAERFLTLEVKVEGALGDIGGSKNFLQAGGSEAFMMDDAAAAGQDMIACVSFHAANSRPVVYLGQCINAGPASMIP